MGQRDQRIGDILVEWGIISQEQLDEALKVSKGAGKRLGEALIDLDYASDDDIAKVLASQFDMEYIDLDQPNPIPHENLPLLPQDLIKKYLVLPLEQTDNRLKILIHDPMDLELLDNLRFRLNCEIDTALAGRSKIKAFVDSMFNETKASIDDAISSMSVDRSAASMDMSVDRGKSMDAAAGSDEESSAGQSPVVRLVNKILSEGIEGDASDIHIEPFADRVRLRYRIDGVCHEMQNIPKRMQKAVIARLKIMAGVKVQEKRVPQDGRIKVKVSGSTYDLRFSTCPCYYGESIVMRILRPESARIGLENLGFEEDTHQQILDLIRRPNGVFLVTGPTGSGKTTTLYSCLDVLNRPDKKIITAEDPVEYNFPGINQCQVKEHVGLTFNRILRAMLRHDPNIVLVGEVRDQEVGEVAIEAALTGHLVFTTLHTNDAPSAITRMINMGLKPFLVASAIQGVLAQRLVRRLCPECKAPDPSPDPYELRLCGMTKKDLEGGTIYKPVGCPTCGHTGYKGRRGIHELMLMNHELRQLAFQQATVSRLREAAFNSGMRNLLADGQRKILKGITTPYEVSKIAQVEGVVGEDEEEEGAEATEEPVAVE